MEVCSDLVPDSPIVPGGAELPDTSPAPSLENPLENLSLVGVSAPSWSGCCSLCAARGVGLRPARPAPYAPAPPRPALRTSGATRLHAVPRGRLCARAGLGVWPSWGGGWLSSASTADLFCSCPCGPASGRQVPPTAGGDSPKVLRTPGSPRPPPLQASLHQVTEIHRHRQNAATRPSRGY